MNIPSAAAVAPFTSANTASLWPINQCEPIVCIAASVLHLYLQSIYFARNIESAIHSQSVQSIDVCLCLDFMIAILSILQRVKEFSFYLNTHFQEEMMMRYG